MTRECILEKINISGYNNMNSHNTNYDNTINDLINCDLLYFILIDKHTLINILYSMKYIFLIFINIYMSIK